MTNKPVDATTDVGALLSEVVDQMLEGFQVISSEWKYLYVNETVAKQGRKRKGELIGRTMMECYPGIEETPLFTKLRRVMEQKKSEYFENRFTYPDGAEGWFQLFIHPVTGGILILSLDVTERKRIEDALKEKIDEIDMLMGSTIDRETHMAALKTEIENLKELAHSER